MTIARSKIVSLEVTPWYHCTTNCVRGAFLCGKDSETGKNYEHRKKWIENRALALTKTFCIDLAGYAIMSNHYHIVIKVNAEKATSLSDSEVVEKWLSIYSGTPLARRFCNGDVLADDERRLLSDDIKKWRTELSNLSRYMKELNQYISRRANKEDGTKGRFWQARFDSQAILDDQALLRTLVYVDLNPVRADIVKTPEEAKYTSLNRRLTESDSGLLSFSDKPFEQTSGHSNLTELPCTFAEYLAILDWTGRSIIENKRGYIPTDAPGIFDRLQYAPYRWLRSMNPTSQWQQCALGVSESIKRFCDFHGRKWIWQFPDFEIR